MKTPNSIHTAAATRTAFSGNQSRAQHQVLKFRRTWRTGIAIAAILAAAVALPFSRAAANGFSSAAFIQPTDLVAFQGFGGAVAADGNVMAIGVQRAPFAVYVYANTNGVWTLQAKLTSPSGSLTDRFGSSLAVEGNTLVVGGSINGVACAYVFTNINGTWIEQQVITPTGGSGISFAGSSLNGISISGNTLAVGAPSESTPAGNTGSVYVFTNSNGLWVQQARIVPTDPLVAWFGVTVSVQNDSLAVGAPLTSSLTLFDPGAAFLFTRQNGAWAQQRRFDPVDAVAAGLYGLCVSLAGNTVVIGAQRQCEAEVYFNNNGTWSLQAFITGPEDSDFGTSVKVIGDLLMVTAYDDVSLNGFLSGDAFIYKRGGSTWTEQPNLYMAPGVNGIPGPGQDRQRFGNFSTITKAGSQTIFVIGSQTYSTANLSQAGAVYTAILN